MAVQSCRQFPVLGENPLQCWSLPGAHTLRGSKGALLLLVQSYLVQEHAKSVICSLKADMTATKEREVTRCLTEYVAPADPSSEEDPPKDWELQIISCSGPCKNLKCCSFKANMIDGLGD